MIYLFIEPNKVYRNFSYRKRMYFGVLMGLDVVSLEETTFGLNYNVVICFQKRNRSSREMIQPFWFCLFFVFAVSMPQLRGL